MRLCFQTTCKLQLHSMSIENMIIVGKASQKLTPDGYPKNDATDLRASILQDNVSITKYNISNIRSYIATTVSDKSNKP